MGIYDVRFCKQEELPLLLTFIKDHWQVDHIFVKSIEMLNFQHLDYECSRYNFIIGFNNISNEIDGIVGLIPIGHFDPDLNMHNDTWGGIWKVRTDIKNDEISNLGAKLFGIFDQYNSHGSIGMSKIATILHKIRKYKIGTLNQYYILNEKIKENKVAIVKEGFRQIDFPRFSNEVFITKIEDISNFNDFDDVYKPKKSVNYLKNRFQFHPIYKYEFWEIKQNNCLAIIVTRKISFNNSSIIRIVDVYGKLENFSSLYYPFQELLNNEKAEYIDLLNFGLDSKIFDILGFKKLDINGLNIIPNYFEPFLQKNIEINCAYRSIDNYVIFKADADQDRPSIISNL
jgi:hypothetical protein